VHRSAVRARRWKSVLLLSTRSGLQVEVRPATGDDTALLMSFIHSMAAFERLQVQTDEQTLRETLFEGEPAAHALLAFVDGEPAAYVTYYFSFATMVGKRGLWLDDLFVMPAFRGQGIATALMAYLADAACRRDCARFEWMVLDWNRRAIEFYEHLGATVLTDWRICRLDGDGLDRAARELRPAEGK
jgi:GNAT superfamily N-acetyltransferase